MEAVAVQNIPKDVGARPLGPPKGLESGSEAKDFGALMQKLRPEDKDKPKVAEEKSQTAEERPQVAEEKSEAAKEKPQSAEDKPQVAEERSQAAEEDPKAESSENEKSEEAAEKSPSVEPGFTAPGFLAEVVPRPADEKFAEALFSLVARETSGDGPDEAAVPFTAPRPADESFAEALANLVTDGPPKGEPAQVSAKNVPAGPSDSGAEAAAGQQAGGGSEGVGEAVREIAVEHADLSPPVGLKEESSELKEALLAAAQEKSNKNAKTSGLEHPVQTKPEEISQASQGKASEAPKGEARGVLISSDSPQGKGFEVSQEAKAASQAEVNSAKEAPNVAPAPGTPKEAVEVEAANLSRPEKTNEAGVKPIEPAAGGQGPQAGERSVEGLAHPQPPAPAVETSQASRPAAPPVVDRIVEKVVELVQAGGPKDRHEVSIQLEPPSLGRVNLQIVFEDSKLNVALLTTTHEARTLVESNVSHLKSALEQQGLALEQFSVGVRSGLAENMGQQNWAAWQGHGPKGPVFGPQAAGPVGQAVEPLSYLGRRDALAQIDLFI